MGMVRKAVQDTVIALFLVWQNGFWAGRGRGMGSEVAKLSKVERVYRCFVRDAPSRYYFCQYGSALADLRPRTSTKYWRDWPNNCFKILRRRRGRSTGALHAIQRRRSQNYTSCGARSRDLNLQYTLFLYAHRAEGTPRVIITLCLPLSIGSVGTCRPLKL
jgi:hypothetical protein